MGEEREGDYVKYRLVEPYGERDASQGYGDGSSGDAYLQSFAPAIDVKGFDVHYQQGKDQSTSEADEIVNQNPN